MSEDSVFALGRVVTLANQLNAGELLNSYTYAFNTKGLRSKVTYANGNTSCCLDEASGFVA